MAKKWAGNTKEGVKGFQKTQPKPVSPSTYSATAPGFFSRIFNRKTTSSSPPTQHLDALNAKYEKAREGLGDKVECRYCGKKKLYKLMKEPDGQIVCQGCSRGGEGDNFIKSGEWLAPSPAEIRSAKKKDKEAGSSGEPQLLTGKVSSPQEQDQQVEYYARMHKAGLRAPFTDTP